MQSCTVVVANEALAPDDVTYAAIPKALFKAVPFGAASKQIVRAVGDTSVDMFAVFDTSTNFPANLSGMALFMAVKDSAGIVAQVRGKVSRETNNLVSFTVKDISAGFYTYDVSVKANEYSQSLLQGSYVVKN